MVIKNPVQQISKKTYMIASLFSNSYCPFKQFFFVSVFRSLSKLILQFPFDLTSMSNSYRHLVISKELLTLKIFLSFFLQNTNLTADSWLYI